MNRSISRIIVLVLTVALIAGCLVFPASATSDTSDTEYLDNVWLDVLEYSGYSEDVSNYKSVSKTGTSAYFSYSLYSYYRFFGYDILVRTDGEITDISLPSYGAAEVYEVSPGLYRIFYEGEFSKSSLSFYLTYSGSTFVEIQSFRMRVVDDLTFQGYVTMECYAGGFGFYKTQESGPYESLSYQFDDYAEESDNYLDVQSWNASLSVEDWYLYDYLEFYVEFNVDSLDYVYAEQFGDDLPVSITYFDVGSNVGTAALIRVDVSNCRRGSAYSYIPVLHLGGTFYYIRSGEVSGSGRFFRVSYCNCYIKNTVINQITLWFKRLYLVLLDIFDGIDSLVYGGPESVSNAVESQLEVNVQVNEQMAESIDEWNTQHLVLSDSADSAVLAATPALAWLSTIADTLFNNMGWFGTLYFFVGLLSIYFLLLSKSGLAHKISNSIGSDKHPNKKN